MVEEGFASVAKTGEQIGSPSLHHVKGELLLAQNPSDVAEAEQCFRTAIEIARRQSARSAELRATTSLARLLAKQGRRDEARAMLAEIYNWFTEGFDTADLKDAKALLDRVECVRMRCAASARQKIARGESSVRSAAPPESSMRSCGAENPPGEEILWRLRNGSHRHASRARARGFRGEDKRARTSGHPAQTDASAPTGERRHLTVLFCDLVGSTEIASHLDPEQWREIVGEYHRAAAQAIERFGGKCRAVPRRRRDGLLRLARGARQRRRARRARGPRDPRGNNQT